MHAGALAIGNEAVHALTSRIRTPDHFENFEAGTLDAVATSTALSNSQSVTEWTESLHAEAGVNCTHCHAEGASTDSDYSEVTSQWLETPSTVVCTSCHELS